MNKNIITLDVRDDLRSGLSPLSAVLNVAATLRPDETLRVSDERSIAQGSQWALLGLAGVEDAVVEIVWDPAWQPSMMTEIERAAVGMR
jgi:hypothetical protein